MVLLLMEEGTHLMEQLIGIPGFLLSLIELTLFLNLLQLLHDPTSPFYVFLINFRITVLLLRQMMRFLRLLRLLQCFLLLVHIKFITRFTLMM